MNPPDNIDQLIQALQDKADYYAREADRIRAMLKVYRDGAPFAPANPAEKVRPVANTQEVATRPSSRASEQIDLDNPKTSREKTIAAALTFPEGELLTSRILFERMVDLKWSSRETERNDMKYISAVVSEDRSKWFEKRGLIGKTRQVVLKPEHFALLKEKATPES